MSARRSRNGEATGAPVSASDELARRFSIVGLGASAGGLEALGRFVDALPADTGIAYIVIQHLDPLHESLLVDLLASHTRLTVQQASDGLALQPDHIYIIPPGAYLAIEGERLRVSEPQERRGSRLPFDFLLYSMAREAGRHAIGVVLSGTGADGTKGFADLRARGGFTIAQDPDETAFDGMPRSAINAGVVDMVLPVADIPAALIDHVQRVRARTAGSVAPPSPRGANTDVASQLPAILELLHAKSSHRFSLYKHGTLQRRIDRRMRLAGIADASRYLDLLRRDAGELGSLTKDLLITVARFFRDSNVFDAMATRIVPEMVATHSTDEPLRIWVAGCSTGEEVYSIAILFLEAIEAAGRSIALQIFGSDIDEGAVAHARQGIYPPSIAADVSPSRLARFFVQENGTYHVLPELRASVVFTVQDLLADPPFSRADLIACRNLLIYLQPEAQQKVLLLFHFALNDGGILLLGGSETVGTLDDRFMPVSKAHRIYRRIGASRPGEVQLPIGEGSRPPRPHWLNHGRAESRAPGIAEQAERMLLEAFAPASVVIDADLTALHFFGPVDRYLHLAPGEPSRDLPRLVREGLRGKLRDAVRRAQLTAARVELGGIRVERDETTAEVRIVVQPMPPAGGSAGDTGAGEALLLVSFQDMETRPRSAPTPDLPTDRPRITELERELDATRSELDNALHDLELTHEEQRTIDEEAMSVNEEFQSTNEELVTSKEELQSLNEELTALNNQMQETLERQRSTSNDLKNILDSTAAATLFLDRDLKIRFFTPGVTGVFKIIPGDIGRPLSDLSTLTAGHDLPREARQVLDQGVPIQHPIETADGNWLLRNIVPYRTQQGNVEGVVVTFDDITTTMLARRELEAARSYLDSIINTVRKPLVVLDAEWRIMSGNHAFFSDLELDPVTSIGKKLSLGTDASAESPELLAFLDRVNGEHEPAADYETGIQLQRRGTRQLVMHARRLPGDLPRGRRILLLIDDVTDQKRDAAALQSARLAADRANLSKSRYLASASHDLRQPLQTIRLLRDLLERKVTEAGASELLNRLDQAVEAMASILNTLLDVNEIESGVVRPNISSFPISGLLERLEAEFGFHAQALALDWRVVTCHVTVRSDLRLLEQMIRNLLTNALKYTAKGAGRSARSRVLLGCRRRGGKLLIQIWDNGPGIPQQKLGAIFGEFYQIDNDARERGNGLGLGLSIVKRLADMLGHKVRVASRLGKGSVFSIEVPISGKRPVQEAGKACPAARSASAAKGTILVVEDEPTTRELLTLVLKEAGYATFAAADGRIAIEMVRSGQTRPDAVVVDFNLPNGLNGVQAITQLQQELGAALPVIVLTGDLGAGTLREISARGFRYLPKPADSKELLGALRTMLNGKTPAVPAVPVAAPRPPVASAGKSGVVHVIDDDPILADTMYELLTAAGHPVRVYNSCEAFLEANPEERDGCLLLDERLPGMTGLELLRRLQADGRGPPAIMMTGYGDVKMAVAAMQAGAVDFIEKPAEPGDILTAVRRAREENQDSAKRDASRAEAKNLIAGLTGRQREIMNLVLAGKPSKNIAADLHISQRTVENHRALIMKRTGAKSIPELVRVVLSSR